MNENIVVKVPATSANMGPGFDCLGIALNVWNEVKVSKGPFSIKMNYLPTITIWSIKVSARYLRKLAKLFLKSGWNALMEYH